MNLARILLPDVFLDLEEPIIKRETLADILKLQTLETINTMFPYNDWLHVYTDGSQMKDHVHVGSFLLLCTSGMSQISF